MIRTKRSTSAPNCKEMQILLYNRFLCSKHQLDKSSANVPVASWCCTSMHETRRGRTRSSGADEVLENQSSRAFRERGAPASELLQRIPKRRALFHEYRSKPCTRDRRKTARSKSFCVLRRMNSFFLAATLRNGCVKYY